MHTWKTTIHPSRGRLRNLLTDEERGKLRSHPDDRFPVADRLDVRVGKTPYVRFDGNDYMVPHDRVRRGLTVVATGDAVRVLDGAAEVAPRRLLELQAERGGNIGSTVARLGDLLETFGAAGLEIAIVEAIAADAPHVGAVRQVLDRRRREADRPPPVAATCPTTLGCGRSPCGRVRSSPTTN